MYSKTDIPEVSHPISEAAQLVTLACPTCGVANVLNATDWPKINVSGVFLISPVATFGTVCHGCLNAFAFKPVPLEERLPQLPQGLRTQLHVVSHRGITGHKSWVLRDLNTDQDYELTANTIAGWVIPEGELIGPGIIVTMLPECVVLQLNSGQFYRDIPPPARLDLRSTEPQAL